MNVILLYFLIVYIWSAVYVGAQCPKQCKCSDNKIVPGMGKIHWYQVICHKRLQEIPDLTSLNRTSLPIYLDLSRNLFSNVTKDDFPPGLQIVVFILSRNNLIKMEDDAFKNMAETLQILKLDQMKLQFTHPFTFLRGLSKLTNLTMSLNYQDKETLARGLFYNQELTSLRELKLTKCFITEIKDGAFRGLESLEILDLDHNKLREVSKGILRLPNLKTLKLSSNNFYVLPEATFKSWHFKLGNLAFNHHECFVKPIQDGAFKGLELSLEKLSLENCQLLDIPINAIRKLQNLHSLSLKHNPLTSLGKNSFKGSFCLHAIDLSSTSFSPNAMLFDAQRDCIESITLNNQNLTSVPIKLLEGLRNLHEVNLKDNEIKTLGPNAFGEIPASSLMLSNNPLLEIQEHAFSNLPSSLLIGLENTHLSNIDFILDYGKDKFSKILFEGITIFCTCNMVDMYNLIELEHLVGSCMANGTKFKMNSITTKIYIEKNCFNGTVVTPWTETTKLVPTVTSGLTEPELVTTQTLNKTDNKW